MSFSQYQILPEDLHIEKIVLGTMMEYPDQRITALELIADTDFFVASHKSIFKTILRLYDLNEDIDSSLVISELKRRNELEGVGGFAYVASLVEGIPRNFSIASHIRVIREKSLLRQSMFAGEAFVAELAMEEEPAEAIIARFQTKLMDITASAGKVRAEVVGDIVPRVMAKIGEERSISSQEDALGFTTGIPELDRFTKGLYPNEYTLILAETGGAKTAWSIQIVLENALRGVKSHFFSQEMTKEQLIRRMLASLSTIVKARDIRDPRFMGIHEWKDLQQTAVLLAQLGITIDDSRRLPLDQLLARGRAAIVRDGAKIIVTDFLQLVLAPSGDRHMNDVQKIDAVTLGHRDLAAESKDYGAHVIGLSQYSRPQDGGNGRPQNNRAKGGSTLEQSANNMFHIVREQLEDGSLSTDVEIIVGKQREGKRGRIECVFDEDHLKFKPR